MTKKTAAVSRLLGSLLVLCCLAGAPAPAVADDGGVAAVTEPAAPAPIAVTTPPATVAPTPAAKTGLQNLSDQLLAVLIPVFATFIAGLVGLLLNKAKQKLHLDVSDKTTEQWKSLARQAALRGAEWARKKAKELTDDKKVPGPEVLDVAVNWATDMAVSQGLPELARGRLEGLIEAELFKLRVEGLRGAREGLTHA